jgi:hypothetical protein
MTNMGTDLEANMSGSGLREKVIHDTSLGIPVKEPSPPSVKDDYVVTYEGSDDPLNPQNLPASKKWLYAVILGLLAFSITFASTVFSTATKATAAEFGVSSEVTTLGTALFVLGSPSLLI